MKRTWPLHVLILPSLLFLIVFSYIPMAGIVIAFQDFKPWLGFTGSPWVGLGNLSYLFEREDSVQVIWNTLFLSMLKLPLHLLVPLVFALLLNEVRKMAVKRFVQTMVYLPYFLSWVILSGILLSMLSTDGGYVNILLNNIFGIGPIPFLMDGNWFRFTVITSDLWKEFGFAAIVFLAAITNIDPSLYEAAEVDGASRFKMTIFITLPSMLPIIIVVATLSLGSILNANFDQIFNLYNPTVYDKGDVIDTFVYRVGIINGEMGFGAAVGLFKSIVSMILIIVSYVCAYKWANYRIF